jgi:AcrR family transcriptional regulator
MVKPRVRLDAGRRRDEILASALRLFARQGYAAAGTRQLAAAAGVTEPILYRHFAGKEALFAAVLDVVTGRLIKALTAVLDGAAGARERLRALAGGLPALLRRHDDELRVLCAAAASRADAPEARGARRALTRIGRHLARELAGSGLRRGVDAQTAAFFLLEIGLGSALLRPVGVSAVRRPVFGAQVIEWITEALLGPQRARG